MGWIRTEDGLYYRRWINLLPNLLLTGTSQFLSGRKKAGLFWMLAYFFFTALILGIYLYPTTPYSISSRGPFAYFPLVFILAGLADACRQPIPVIAFWKWCLVVAAMVVILLAPFLFIRSFVVQPFNLPTNSMTPTLLGDLKDENGVMSGSDHFLVYKLAYLFDDPKRGDLVAFKTDDLEEVRALGDTSPYLKRIVGLPGEKISILPPDILINGNKITEPDFFRKMSEKKDGYAGYFILQSSRFLRDKSDTFTLGPEEYFVVGDNSEYSLDSRFFGPIKRNAIFGKAFYIYEPASRKRFLR